jgi:hypothetical protein
VGCVALGCVGPRWGRWGESGERGRATKQQQSSGKAARADKLGAMWEWEENVRPCLAWNPWESLESLETQPLNVFLNSAVHLSSHSLSQTSASLIFACCDHGERRPRVPRSTRSPKAFSFRPSPPLAASCAQLCPCVHTSTPHATGCGIFSRAPLKCLWSASGMGPAASRAGAPAILSLHYPIHLSRARPATTSHCTAHAFYFTHQLARSLAN